MALSDFGFRPDPDEDQRARERRDVQHPDESGLRPLPTESVPPDGIEYEDANDERVSLPVSFSSATLFGIGAGVGFTAFAIVIGLYGFGVIGSPPLNPAQPASTVAPDLRPFDEAARAESIERGRLVGAVPFAPTVTRPAKLVDSPDIQVLDEHPAAPETAPAERPMLTEPPMPPPTPTAPPEREPLPAPAQPTAPAETTAPQNPY